MIAEVIAAYGRHLLLRDADGALQKARPFGRALEIVCGDRVQCEVHGAELLVSGALPRTCLIRRSTARGLSEPLAANLTQMAIAIAPVPLPDLFLLDRYLSCAESLGVRALIILNKKDLPEASGLHEAMQTYSTLGYDTVSVSAHDEDSVAPLRKALLDRLTILVGQSGVGKSSLTCAITGKAGDIAIGGLMRDEEGRHTTSASRMYDCPGGGRLIDTPGVRDFAPAIDDLEPATLGFREVALLGSQCRFLDCRHMQEPDCAVSAAASDGAMDPRRYESYRRLRRLFEQLWQKRSASERAARRR